MNDSPPYTSSTKQQLKEIRTKVQLMRSTAQGVALAKVEAELAQAEFESVVAQEQIRVKAVFDLEIEQARARARLNETDECCPICLIDFLPLQFNGELERQRSSTWACCGKICCEKCADEWEAKQREGLFDGETMNQCPLCKEIFPKNDKERLETIKRHVENGKGWAMYMLSCWYKIGNGMVRKNAKKAHDLCFKAAKKGVAKAQYEIAMGYFQGENFGQRFKKSDTNTAIWAKAAADQGHAHAQHLIGALYSLGRGVAMDTDETYRMFTLSAYQGNAEAAKSLAEFISKKNFTQQQLQHSTPGMTVSKLSDCADFNLSLYWFGKSAEKGYSVGMVNLLYQLLSAITQWHANIETDVLAGYSVFPLMMWLILKIKSDHQDDPDNIDLQFAVTSMDTTVVPFLSQWKHMCAGCGQNRSQKLKACSNWYVGCAFGTA